MGTGVAVGAIGGAVAVGAVGQAVGNKVNAGDEGWDADGNYVCSKFVFNFRARQVFDGGWTHNVENITEYSYDGQIIKMFKKGKIKPIIVNVGSVQRSETIGKLLADMWNGVHYEPEVDNPLPSFELRVRQLTLGVIFRYAVRSVLAGAVIGALWTEAAGMLGDARSTAILWTIPVIFGLSCAFRLFRPIVKPKWRTAELPST